MVVFIINYKDMRIPHCNLIPISILIRKFYYSLHSLKNLIFNGQRSIGASRSIIATISLKYPQDAIKFY